MEEEVKNAYSGEKKNTTMAVVAYLLFFIPLLTEAKDDPFVKFHVKQGLVLLVAELIAMAVSRIPVLGWFSGLLGLGVFFLLIIGILNALKGQEKPLPVIGQFAERLNF